MTKRESFLLKSMRGRRRQELMRAQAQAELEKISRVQGGGRMSRQLFPTRGPSSGAPNDPQALYHGQMRSRYGEMPQPAQVDQLMRTTGMGPQTMAQAMRQQDIAKQRAAKAGGPELPAEPTEIEVLRDKLANEQRRQQRRYEFDQENRYNEIVGGRAALRDRVLGGMVGQGQAAEAQYNEESKNDLERIRAYLIERGLAGSTILPAFMQENSKQLNLRMDANREKQAAAMADADMRLSDGLYGAMERRQDTPPDNALLAQLEAKLGAAAAYQAQPQPKPAKQSAPSLPQGRGGVSASRAAQLAAQISGQFNPMGMAQGMYGGFAAPAMAALSNRFGGQAQQPIAPQPLTEEQEFKQIAQFAGRQKRVNAERFGRTQRRQSRIQDRLVRKYGY